MKETLRLRTVQDVHSPLGTSKGLLGGRKRLVMTSAGEGTWQGEAAPLPGYGVDSLELAGRELEAIVPTQLLEHELHIVSRFEAMGGNLEPLQLADLLDDFTSLMASPSARFCVESLVLLRASSKLGIPLWRLLTPTPVASSLPTSEVLDPLSPDWRQSAERFLSVGGSCFKIKCGRDLEREVAAAEQLSELSDVRLRFDANGAWQPSEARKFAEEVAHLQVDWIEDPVADVREWEDIGGPIPLALDEPLAFLPRSELAEIDSKIWILKPMALGLSRSLRLSAHAKESHRACSLSHFFDGHQAMRVYIELAFALQSPGLAPGLGEHRALDDPGESLSRMLQKGELLLPQARA